MHPEIHITCLLYSLIKQINKVPPGGLTLVTIIAKAPTWHQQHWCPDSNSNCWNFTLRTCKYHVLQPGQHGFIHRGHYIVWLSTPLKSALVHSKKIHFKITKKYIITGHRCNRSTGLCNKNIYIILAGIHGCLNNYHVERQKSSNQQKWNPPPKIQVKVCSQLGTHDSDYPWKHTFL